MWLGLSECWLDAHTTEPCTGALALEQRVDDVY